MIFCALFSVAVLLEAISTSLEQALPANALQLNPLNDSARAAYAGSGFDENDQLKDADRREALSSGLSLSPREARLTSLAGLAIQGDGDLAKAELVYDQALAVQQTEFVALAQKITFEYNRREWEKAATHAEVVLRRWPERWTSIEPLLGNILADKNASERFVDGISGDFALREKLISTLAAYPDNLGLAFNAVARWHKTGIQNLDAQIHIVIERLIAQKRYPDAYRLFAITRPQDRPVRDIVYNGDFSSTPGQTRFDWKLLNLSGVEVEIPKETAPEGKNPARSLSIRFLDRPAFIQGPWQYLRMAPSKYQLKLEYSTSNLSGPEPVRLELICIPGNQIIIATPVKSGTAEKQMSITDFFVPQGCELALLRFANNKLPESWKNRYKGRLNIFSIKIEKT